MKWIYLGETGALMFGGGKLIHGQVIEAPEITLAGNPLFACAEEPPAPKAKKKHQLEESEVEDG